MSLTEDQRLIALEELHRFIAAVNERIPRLAEWLCCPPGTVDPLTFGDADVDDYLQHVEERLTR